VGSASGTVNVYVLYPTLVGLRTKTHTSRSSQTNGMLMRKQTRCSQQRSVSAYYKRLYTNTIRFQQHLTTDAFCLLNGIWSVHF